MPRRFFDNLLDSRGGPGRPRRKLTLPVSIAVHVVVLLAVFILPLLSYNQLPDPVMDGAIRAFLVEAAPPPPPPSPPPPPPPAAAAQPVRPKIETPKAEPTPQPVQEQPKFTAPVETPAKVTESEPGPDLGVGVPGGEPGGVEGG